MKRVRVVSSMTVVFSENQSVNTTMISVYTGFTKEEVERNTAIVGDIAETGWHVDSVEEVEDA